MALTMVNEAQQLRRQIVSKVHLFSQTCTAWVQVLGGQKLCYITLQALAVITDMTLHS